MSSSPRAVTLCASLALAALLVPALRAAGEEMEGHISIVPSEIVWQESPAIGPGAAVAVLEGDLTQATPFTFRVRMPSDFKIAPHTHPVFERVTVLSGTFHLGIGETFDPAKARAYPPGGVAMMPAGMPMFAFTTTEETVIQVHGTGPWGIQYVDPADDPRNR